MLSVPLIGADTVMASAIGVLASSGAWIASSQWSAPRRARLVAGRSGPETRGGQATGDWQLTAGIVPFRLSGRTFRPCRQGPPLPACSPAASEAGRTTDYRRMPSLPMISR